MYNLYLKFDKTIIENSTNISPDIYETLKCEPNNNFLMKDIHNLKEFLVKHVYNPKSPFYIDLSETRPCMENTIKSIHKAGGVAILAHLGRYIFDVKSEINNMISKGLDGLEVWHSDNLQEISGFLLEKVKEQNLLASGGSDDHCVPSAWTKYHIGIHEIQQIPHTEWIRQSACLAKDFARTSEYIPDAINKLKKVKESTNNKIFLNSLKVDMVEIVQNSENNDYERNCEKHEINER